MMLFEEHKGRFDELLHQTKDDSCNPIKVIEEGYAFIKNIANDYYVDGKMTEQYEELLKKLTRLEKLCLGNYNMLLFSQLFNPYQEPEESLLDYVIWHGRRLLLNEKGHYGPEELYKWGFNNLCFFGSSDIKETCRKLGIKCSLITIIRTPFKDKKIECKTKFHSFNIIEFESKRYLVDITLAQFFRSKNNHPGRLGVAGLEGPSVGCYMMRLPRGQEIANALFTKGYIELDSEVFKTYMDAFTLSRRNGIYYEEGGIVFPYSISQYKDFAKGIDSQMNHEPLHCLGLQRRPLKNPNTTVFNQLPEL